MADTSNYYHADLDAVNLDDLSDIDKVLTFKITPTPIKDDTKVEVDINPKASDENAAKTITESVQADSEPQERALTPKEQILFTHPAIFAAMDPPLVTMLKENEIVCPFCGNGTGSDHTGVQVKLLDKGYKYKCFKCGRRFDNLDIYAEYYGLDVEKNFKAVEHGALEAIAKVPSDAVPEYSVDVAKPKVIKDYLNFINRSRENLKSFVDSHGGTWRGLTYETLENFGIGYQSSFGEPKTPRVIIPTSRRHFLARFVGNLEDYSDADKIKPKQHFGTKEFFNYLGVAKWVKVQACKNKLTKENIKRVSISPIFLTEGEIDAMSLSQLTGCQVMSSCGKELTKSMFNFFAEDFFIGAPFIFIVMYDNDEAGIAGAIKTAEKLNTIDKVTAVAAPLGTFEQGKYKPLTDSAGNVINDINDGLNINPEGTRAIIESTLNAAKDLAKHLDEGGTLKNFKSIFSEFYNYAKATTSEVDAFNNSTGENAVKLATTRKKIPSCPVDLFIPGGFGFDEFCIAEQGKPFTSTPVVITKALIDADSGLHYSELAFYKKATGKWKGGIVVQDDVIADGKKFLLLSSQGIDVNQKTAKTFVVYLTSLKHFWRNEDLIPKVYLHNFTGWIDENCKTFMYPSRNVDGHKLRNEDKDYGKKYAALGSYDKWKAKITELYNLSDSHRFNSGVFLLTLGVALAAPAVKLFGTRNLQLLLTCSSGKGKTCVAKAAMSIYGNPKILKNTFDGTAISLSELSTYYNDLPMWIDEFQSAKKGLREEIDKFIYSYAEEVPRLRCKRIGGLNLDKMITFNGSRIMTGEESLLKDNSNAGAYNRLLIVTTDKIFPPGWDIAATHRFFERNCGHFGFEWAQWLSEHGDEIKDYFDRALDGDAEIVTTDIIKKRDDWASNWQEFFIVIYTVLRHALPLIINDFDYARFVVRFCEMMTLISNDVPTDNSNANFERAKILLEDYINSHNKNFRIMVLTPDGMFTRQPATGQTLQGYIDDNLIIDFIPSELVRILEKDLGFTSAKAIIREFAKAGWLDCSEKMANSKHRQFQKNVKAYNDETDSLKWSWVYRFKKGVLQILSDTLEAEE